VANYFNKIPNALSLKILERALGKKETADLIAKYIQERNKNVKLKGAYCHNCGVKIDFKRLKGSL